MVPVKRRLPLKHDTLGKAIRAGKIRTPLKKERVDAPVAASTKSERAAADCAARWHAGRPRSCVPRAISPNAKPDRQRAVVPAAHGHCRSSFDMKSLAAAVPVCPVLCVKSSLQLTPRKVSEACRAVAAVRGVRSY
jgi:hypothetical protein